MKRLAPMALAIMVAMLAPLASAQIPTPADRAFVAKVSQGGLFEVEAGRLAEQKSFSQDVRDFGAMEVHDHILVGDKLKAISTSEGLGLSSHLNADFQGKLDHLSTLSGASFDQAYMRGMSTLHAADGAAFEAESSNGGSAAYREFGAETHLIVQRHIGAIHGAQPSGD